MLFASLHGPLPGPSCSALGNLGRDALGKQCDVVGELTFPTDFVRAVAAPPKKRQ